MALKRVTEKKSHTHFPPLTVAYYGMAGERWAGEGGGSNTISKSVEFFL